MGEDKVPPRSSTGDTGDAIALGDHVPFTLKSHYMAHYIATMSPERREAFEVETAQIQARIHYQNIRSARQTNLSIQGTKRNVALPHRAEPSAEYSYTAHPAVTRSTPPPLDLLDSSKDAIDRQTRPPTQVAEVADALQAFQSRCQILISKILNSELEDSAVLKLSNGEAQILIDFLDIVTHDTKLGPLEQRTALALLRRFVEDSELLPGSYQLEGVECEPEPVTAGGSADIYKGIYQAKVVCVKVFRTLRSVTKHSIIQALSREAIIWAHLRHKNIIPFYGVFSPGHMSSRLSLVSPWMEGGTIREYLHRNPETPRIGFISDILSGLSYMHDLEVVHGDLKGSNILVSDDRRALITDFGVSSIAGAEAFGGTVRWMAPELLLAGGPTVASKACDIWSFACLYYEILTGKDPYYQYNSDVRILTALMRKEVPLPPTPRDSGEITDDLWGVLLRCWNFIPEERPDTSELRELVIPPEIRDDRLEAVQSVEASAAFQPKRESSEVIDYVQLEEILLRVSQYSHPRTPAVGSGLKSQLELTQSTSSPHKFLQILPKASPTPHTQLPAPSGSGSHQSYESRPMSSVEQMQGVARAEVTQSVPLTQLQETRSTNQTEGYVQSESIQRIPVDLGSPPYKGLDGRIQCSSDAMNPDFNGSCADVFIGHFIDGNIRIKVAIKVLRVTHRTTEKIKGYLIQKTAPWHKLDHPNVLQFLGLSYEYGRLGCPALITPYCEKGTMNDYLKIHPDIGTRIFIIKGVSGGLQYIHENDVIHGDLKPSNILIHGNGYPLLCDFDFSGIVSRLGFNTITTRAPGASRYQPLEQLQGGALNKAVDVYAFALSSYEIWTGKQPLYNIRGDMAVTMNILFNEARPEYPDPAPPGTDTLWEILENCWKAEPEERLEIEQVVQQLAKISIPT